MNKKILKSIGLKTECIIKSKGLKLEGSLVNLLFTNIEVITIEEIIGYVIELCSSHGVDWICLITLDKRLGDFRPSMIRIKLTTKKFVWSFHTTIAPETILLNQVKFIKGTDIVTEAAFSHNSLKKHFIFKNMIECEIWSLTSSDFK